MRLMLRGRTAVRCGGREMRAAARPLSGALMNRRYGEYVQDMVRLLLPWDAQIAPGDRLEIEETPYVCVFVRALPGHIQADARRCAR